MATFRWKLYVLLLITAAGVVGVMQVPPIAQDLDYHQFADRGMWLGVPNFWNVVSNVPFVVVGLFGLLRLPLSRNVQPSGNDGLVPGYILLCVFLILLAFGSVWYHYDPTNSTLLWDRLPISGAFMALFVCLLIDAVSARATRLLIPLVLTGLGSVVYWYLTELQGQGDLRPYVLVQFLPIILFPIVLMLFDTTRLRARFLWMTLIGYLVSKLAEHFDTEIFMTLGILSGHALKHMLAALAILCAILAFRKDANSET